MLLWTNLERKPVFTLLDDELVALEFSGKKNFLTFIHISKHDLSAINLQKLIKVTWKKRNARDQTLGLISRLNTAEERISVCEDMTRNISQNEMRNIKFPKM